MADDAVENPLDFLQQNLELRVIAHSKADGDPVLNGKGRSAAVGVSCLIIFPTEKGWATIIRERSPNVAVYRDALHVIPSFMFAAEVGDLEQEYSVRHNVFREYLEEVFNKRQVEQPPPAATFDWFYCKFPDLHYLVDLLESGDAELLLIGLAVDAFTLRTEILTLLIIKSLDWWKNHSHGNQIRHLSHMNINDEFKSQQELWKEQRDIIVRIDLDEEFKPIIQKLPTGVKLDDPAFWVPPGAAAFYHGLHIARKRI